MSVNEGLEELIPSCRHQLSCLLRIQFIFLNEPCEALLRHLLESGFNRSSEHHELNSWFSETVAAGVDPRIASVRDWERATAEDPLFVLEVPWLPTGLSLGKVADRIARVHGRPGRRITCADDVARLVINAKPRRERTR